MIAGLLSTSALLGAGRAAALDPSRRTHQYLTRTWSIDEGLPESSVLGIAQTRDGYIWLGTEEGLVRFDGERFTVFDDHTTPEITNSDVQDVCVDGQGRLWIGTRGGGLVRRDLDGSMRRFDEHDGLASAIVGDLACTARGVWAGTPAGLTRFESDRGHTMTVADGLPSESISALCDDGAEGAWVGTGRGLAHVVGSRVVSARATGLPTPAVTSLHRDADGTIWLGGIAWLARLKGEALTSYVGKEAFSSGTAQSILRDRDGSLWVACFGDALLRMRGETFERFGLDDGLSAAALAKLFEDREGSLWIGSRGGGAQRLSDGKVVALTAKDGITGAMVWSVYADRDGDVWVGTRNGGADRIRRDGRVENLTTKDGLPDDTVYGFTQARDGAMWFATRGGVGRLAHGHFDRFTTKEGLPHDLVHTVYEAPDGVLWIGTNGGVARYAGGVMTTLTRQQGLPTDRILEINGGPDGSVWIGTDGGGIVRWKDGALTAIDKAHGLGDDSAHSVFFDPDGTGWVATFHGLTRMRDGRFASATTRNGLLDDVIFSVLPGPDDTLWMSTNRGLMRLRLAAFDTSARGESARIADVDAFGKADGLPSTECNGGFPAGTRTPDGRLWFANLAGVLRVDPAHLHTNTLAPTVLVESVEAGGTALLVRSERGELLVPAGTRGLTLHYTAPSFVAPERVRFRYRLVGFDATWVDAGSRRTAYFTNLPPGTYAFEVAASNNDGIWNEAGATVRLRVGARFYQTAWFYALAVLAVAGAAAGVFRLRVRALGARARELETRVEERTRELADRDARIRRDLTRARAFQQRTLPVLPPPGRLRFVARYVPADEVGGDVYDVFEVRPGTFRVFLADMTGHGIPAALRTMVLRTEYEGLKRTCADPAAAIAELSRRIYELYPGLQMRCSATCFDLRLHPALEGDGATLSYANACHPPLLHARAGHVEEVYEPSAYVGMLPAYRPRLRTVELAPGDCVVALTDGVFEQPDASGHELGFEAIAAVARDHAPDTEAIAEGMLSVALRVAPGGVLGDDVTVLVIECVRVPELTARRS